MSKNNRKLYLFSKPESIHYTALQTLLGHKKIKFKFIDVSSDAKPNAKAMKKCQVRKSKVDTGVMTVIVDDNTVLYSEKGLDSIDVTEIQAILGGAR